jgi:integrase
VEALSMLDTVENIKLVTEPAETRLNPREEIAYREHRRQIAEWMVSVGKQPDRAEGFSLTTVRARMYRLDKFYRFVWNESGGFTTRITTGHADAWMQQLANSDYARSYKADCQKAVKTLFKWQRSQGDEVQWEPQITFSDPSVNKIEKDVLSSDEWSRVRDAVLDYGSIPGYRSVTPEERSEINAMLAQRFEKPKTQVGPDDWERANSFKFASMFWLGMDLGLRPSEIAKIRVSWLDMDNELVRVPRRESVKNNEPWTCPMLRETADYLRLWIEERAGLEKYEGRELVWLTKFENPYSSWSVNYHWRKIRELAEIDAEHRNMPYYSLRHTQGTNITEEAGIANAGAQLRQRSTRSTEKYLHARQEKQKEALEKTR